MQPAQPLPPTNRPPLPQSAAMLRDFVHFCRYELRTSDYDPALPVLRAYYKILNLTTEEALWHTFLYLAWYNLPSAARVFARYPTPSAILGIDDDILRLPISAMRHGRRNPDTLRAHLRSLVMSWHTSGQSWTDWLGTGLVTGEPDANWRQLVARTCSIAYNGHWAGYKLAEILAFVHGYDATAPSVAISPVGGARAGLSLLYPRVQGSTAAALSQLHAQATELMLYLSVTCDMPLSLDELSDILVNFYAMYRGRYYGGCSIDTLHAHLLRVPQPDASLPHIAALWAARRQTLPEHSLGECMGWFGVDRDLKALYVRTGIPGWRDTTAAPGHAGASPLPLSHDVRGQ